MNSPRWYALQTKTQYERHVVRALQEKVFEPYLPMVCTRRRRKGTISEVPTPLFPGYVFCRFELRNRLHVLRTSFVRSVVSSCGVALSIDEGEIEAVRSAVAFGQNPHPHPFLKVGQWVRVECGAMEGVEGVLLEFRKQYRLVVSITLLERSVAVDIDEAWVSSIPSRDPRPVSERTFISAPSPPRARAVGRR